MEDLPKNRTPMRSRREPPQFRRVAVSRVEQVSPRMVKVTLSGSDLEGLEVNQPAASVRLLLPPHGSQELVMPTWNGNEFLLPGRSRPAIRTFTPLRPEAAPDAPELDLEIVVHEGGVASTWAEAAEPGRPAAISGPGRGYEVDPEAPAFCLAGDETAIPAIGQLLEALPRDKPVQVHIEVAHPDARLTLPEHPQATVHWHDLPAGTAPGDGLLAAVKDAAIDPSEQVWAAGEAAGVQRIRRHLFEERGLSRRQAAIRGYWKHGRAGD